MKLLKTGFSDAYLNMGIDEALMRTCQEPVLRLYGWKPHAVSIGYFQGLEEEVDLDACKRHGVDVVRRVTGGGAVYHADELTYSFVTRQFGGNILDSYRDICAGILLGLKKIGVDGQFAPLNDLIVNGKKFSGNAQTRRGGVLLQHGTILLSVDVDRMFDLLKVPSEKMKGKLISDVKQRVIGIGKSFGDVERAVADGFEEHYGMNLEPMGVSEEQLGLAYTFAGKYRSDEWLGMR
ncbi:lipoate--protein ligase family protein [Candidatus Micrarchaeota archaeon]|nr:lipoate--protein ligase family protein [Candidatus Micrarchaeota archaeon]